MKVWNVGNILFLPFSNEHRVLYPAAYVKCSKWNWIKVWIVRWMAKTFLFHCLFIYVTCRNMTLCSNLIRDGPEWNKLFIFCRFISYFNSHLKMKQTLEKVDYQIKKKHTHTHFQVTYLGAFSCEVSWILEAHGDLPIFAYLLCSGYFIMFVASTILIHGLATGLSWGLFSWSIMVGILSIPELIFVMVMTTQFWVNSTTCIVFIRHIQMSSTWLGSSIDTRNDWDH